MHKTIVIYYLGKALVFVTMIVGFPLVRAYPYGLGSMVGQSQLTLAMYNWHAKTGYDGLTLLCDKTTLENNSLTIIIDFDIYETYIWIFERYMRWTYLDWNVCLSPLSIVWIITW